ncbi:MAG: C45 family autoproteolytic acyltransferase/hydrolase [Acidobacteriota bacterium]
MSERKGQSLTAEESAWIESVRVTHEAGWTHLRIAGEPHARGFQHGYVLAEHYSRCLATYEFVTYQTLGMPYRFFVETAAALHRDKLGDEIAAEMQGIADGLTKAGVPTTLDDVIGWNAWVEITGSWWPLNKGKHASHDTIDHRRCRCSAFIATGSATADRGIVMGHETFDDFWNGVSLNVVLEVWPTAGNAFLMQTSPGYVCSMTDFFVTKHLLGTETTIAGFSGYDDDGIPEYVRARNAMQYGTDIDSFVAKMNEGNNGGYANTWLVGEVATGTIAEYQQGLRHQALERLTDGWIAGANYVTDPRIRNLECQFTGYDDIRQQTGARRTRWPQVLEPHAGSIDAEAGKTMLADHFDLYSNRENPCATTICAHYDVDPRLHMSSPYAVENAPFVGMGSMDGKISTSALAAELGMWGRYGRACGTAFDADAYLQRHPQWNWLEGHLVSRRSEPWALFRGHQD